MAGETTITVIGNLTADPELRFTPAGAAVANFTIANTPRNFNRQTNEWEDGETLFLRAAVWREAAENVRETLTKGMRVIATGRLKSRQYETKEGEKRTVIELEVDEIGPSLKYAQAQVRRIQQGQGGNQGNANTYDPAAAQRGQQGGFGGQQQGGFGGGGFGGQQQPATGPNSQWGTGVDPGYQQGYQQRGQAATYDPQQAQQGGSGFGQQGQQPPQQQPQAGQQQPGGWPGQTVQQDDPWATPNGGGWGNGPQSEPPF
jgi:single-strand DNA-binding protein